MTGEVAEVDLDQCEVEIVFRETAQGRIKLPLYLTTLLCKIFLYVWVGYCHSTITCACKILIRVYYLLDAKCQLRSCVKIKIDVIIFQTRKVS